MVKILWRSVLTAQKMKFPVDNSFRKCEQILQICSHLLKKLLTENFFVKCLLKLQTLCNLQNLQKTK